MSAEKIAHRYATALLSLTGSQLALQDKIIHDLNEMASLFENKPIRKIIANPIVSSELLRDIFANLSKQLQADDTLVRLIGVLIDAKRTSVIPTLAKAYRDLVQKSRGIVDAVVTTAVALQASELKDIGRKLETMLQKKVNLLQSLDDSILGGFVIRIENSVLDMSLKTKLEHMTKFAVS